MNALATLDTLEEESVDVGSYKHSSAQANLTFLLKRLGQYAVLTDLSLDISKADISQFDISTKEEIKPDVCIYLKRQRNLQNDILRMTEMPLLAIEVLSPKQGVYDILEKFKLYFALGVQSCWLVIPSTRTVFVYSAPDRFVTFGTGEVIDELLGIQLPIEEIFE
ncbi:MAG: Uma2 family endonuclease [Caldilineaceae bacterium]